MVLENIKKRAAVKLPAKAGIWSIVSGLVARGVGVVGTPIFTRLLTPAEYGLYPLYTTWLSVVAAAVTAGLTGSAIYRGLQKYRTKKEEFISAATGFGLCAALIALLIGIPFGGAISDLTGLSRGVLLLLICEVALSAVISFRSAQLRYEYRYRALALTNLFSAIGTPLLSVMFVVLTPYRAEARILGSLIATAAVALPTLFGMLRRGGRLYDGEIWRYLLRVNIPLLPHYLSSSLILRVSEMVIGRSHGEAALAKYSVGISVGLALTFLTNAVSQVTSPWIMRKVAAGEFEKLRETVGLILRALLLVTLIVLAIAPEILAIITPPEYADALPAVYPLALSVSAMFLSNSIMSAEAFYERSARSALPTVMTAAASTVAAVLILPEIDYRYSALFTLGAYLLLVILSHVMFRKISGERIINTRVCALLFTISALYAALLFVFRGVILSRALLILPLIPPLWNVCRRVWWEVKEAK